MRTKLILTACLFLFVGNALLAQQSALPDQLQRFGAENPQEKVYLHLDKPHYIAGDNIWLKGYVTLGPQNQLSALSSTLHVDLVDPGNKLISTIKSKRLACQQFCRKDIRLR